MLDPKFVDAHYNKGIALQSLGELRKAIESYNIAVLLDPNNSNFYFNKGNALLSLEEFKEAIESYNIAI